MARATRVISAEHLAKMQAGAKAARKAKEATGRKCGDCGRKVKPQADAETKAGRYLRSTTRPGVVYCWPGTGCWKKPA